MNPELRDKLFAVIRSGMDQDGSAAPSLSAEECDEILRFAARQSILPIIYRGLRTQDVSADVLKDFEKARLKGIHRYILQNDALNRICAALNEAQAPYIPLKGAVLRNLYPEPELRTSCDIDVLVHEDDLEKVVAAIENATDFKFRMRNYHDVSMVSPHVHLELHFSILENMENIDQLLIRVWDYAGPSGDGYRYVLTPEFQIFHVIAHMSYHMVHGGLGIRPFLDLWLLRTKTSFDEDTVRQMCSDCSILTFYEKCSQLAEAWMTGKPLPEDLMVLEEYAMNGGVFGSGETAAAAKRREHTEFRYYIHRLFASKAVMAAEYPELEKKPYLLPLCWVKRWMRILNPQKRKRVKAEINGVRKVSAEAIDSFDKLLVSLGL